MTAGPMRLSGVVETSSPCPDNSMCVQNSRRPGYYPRLRMVPISPLHCTGKVILQVGGGVKTSKNH